MEHTERVSAALSTALVAVLSALVLRDVSVDWAMEGKPFWKTVADNGPDVSDTARLFGKDETGADSSGTGLGLYLVETLVVEFDGRVWVEDNDPTGAVFCVELPRTDTDPEPA